MDGTRKQAVLDAIEKSEQALVLFKRALRMRGDERCQAMAEADRLQAEAHRVIFNREPAASLSETAALAESIANGGDDL